MQNNNKNNIKSITIKKTKKNKYQSQFPTDFNADSLV